LVIGAGSSDAGPFDFRPSTSSLNSSGLAPGIDHATLTVSSPDDPGGTQVVNVTLQVNASTYAGAFTGYVQNDDGADGGNDVGTSFVDSFGGNVSMTVAPNFGGGYTLTFQGYLTTATPHDEDFSANFNVHVNVNNPSSIAFTTPMGDGNMLVQGGIANGTFSGAWRFVATDPNDSSDSGSGVFSLSR
jgi:hypothetical protein